MAEEEAFALDEKWTKITLKVGPNGSGFLAGRKIARMVTIDGLSSTFYQRSPFPTENHW